MLELFLQHKMHNSRDTVEVIDVQSHRHQPTSLSLGYKSKKIKIMISFHSAFLMAILRVGHSISAFIIMYSGYDTAAVDMFLCYSFYCSRDSREYGDASLTIQRLQLYTFGGL